MIRPQTSDMLCVDPYEECCCCWLEISVSPRFEWQPGISQSSCADEAHHANLFPASLICQFTFISFLWTLTHRRSRVDRTRVRNKKGPVTLDAATILPDLTSAGANRKRYLSWRHVNWSSRRLSTKEDKLFFPRVFEGKSPCPRSPLGSHPFSWLYRHGVGRKGLNSQPYGQNCSCRSAFSSPFSFLFSQKKTPVSGWGWRGRGGGELFYTQNTI